MDTALPPFPMNPQVECSVLLLAATHLRTGRDPRCAAAATALARAVR